MMELAIESVTMELAIVLVIVTDASMIIATRVSVMTPGEVTEPVTIQL